MLLDNGEIVYFGQHLRDAEGIFSSTAIDNPLRVARKRIDKQIKTDLVRLDFDSDLLTSIELGKDYQYKNPLVPYAKTWKNFISIGGKAIRPRMDRADFMDYLSEWEGRAQALGAKGAKSGDLNEDEYCVQFTRDEFCDSVHIAMGPSRRSGGGGIWTDGWHIFFAIKEPIGKLKTVSAFCDQFNTVAR